MRALAFDGTGRVDAVCAFGADPHGRRSSSAALQDAIDATAGQVTICLPPGRFEIDVGILAVASGPGQLSPGVRLEGAGAGATVLVSRVANGPMLTIDTGKAFAFANGVTMRNLTLDGAGAALDGLMMARVQRARLDAVEIRDFRGDGLRMPVRIGDADGSAGVELDRCCIRACGGRGLFADVPAGRTELSNVRINGSTIAQCGTGITWRGQGLSLEHVGLTENGFALDVGGGADGSLALRAISCDFENNGSHVRLAGLDSGRFELCRFYSLPNSGVRSAIYFDGSAALVRNVELLAPIVRVGEGNANFCAFDGVGPNLDSISIVTPSWRQEPTGGARISASVLSAAPSKGTQ